MRPSDIYIYVCLPVGLSDLQTFEWGRRDPVHVFKFNLEGGSFLLLKFEFLFELFCIFQICFSPRSSVLDLAWSLRCGWQLR